MKNLLFLIAVVCVTWSCDVPVKLDLNQTESKIVIDGLISNQPKRQYVKVSRTSDFYSSGKTPRVTNAVVTVTDDQDVVQIFVHNPNNHPDSAGYYLPETEFTGAIGRTYTLKVDVAGEIYTASDKLFAVTTIDKLESKLDEDEKEDPEIPGRFYEALLFTKEPQETKDFYLFKFYRNDSLVFDTETDIYFSDDEYLAENIDGVESPVFYSPGDKAKVEMYSISRNAFVFYSDLSKLLNNDGGLFGSPPANCRNNLNNGALGYFQASAIDTKELLIEQ